MSEIYPDSPLRGQTPFQLWQAHLGDCRVCRLAIRGRFAAASMQSMAARCCDTGRPLYVALINEPRWVEK